MTTQIYVNLPVKNLDKTMKFYSKIGFKFNPKFTDKKGACMIVGKDMFVMLVVEKFFQTFTKKKIINSRKDIETIMGLSADSRKKVDQMVSAAIKAGGIEPKPAVDHGWMYGRDFEDPDGHLWEIIYMDEKKFPGTEK